MLIQQFEETLSPSLVKFIYQSVRISFSTLSLLSFLSPHSRTCMGSTHNQRSPMLFLLFLPFSPRCAKLKCAQNLSMRRGGVSGPHPCDAALVRAVMFSAVQQTSANGRASSVDAGIRRWSQFDGRKWIEGEVLKD